MFFVQIEPHYTHSKPFNRCRIFLTSNSRFCLWHEGVDQATYGGVICKCNTASVTLKWRKRYSCRCSCFHSGKARIRKERSSLPVETSLQLGMLKGKDLEPFGWAYRWEGYGLVVWLWPSPRAPVMSPAISIWSSAKLECENGSSWEGSGITFPNVWKSRPISPGPTRKLCI